MQREHGFFYIDETGRLHDITEYVDDEVADYSPEEKLKILEDLEALEEKGWEKSVTITSGFFGGRSGNTQQESEPSEVMGMLENFGDKGWELTPQEVEYLKNSLIKGADEFSQSTNPEEQGMTHIAKQMLGYLDEKFNTNLLDSALELERELAPEPEPEPEESIWDEKELRWMIQGARHEAMLFELDGGRHRLAWLLNNLADALEESLDG